ncbi:polyamine aminopropyltransferase [Aliifodinibius sp. S!AR15-10]|uniref:polyamine aminopropyltransferase n=1 Tax=Aliifodinibius sp. S!AR15-10 TaxID=2950437 RepID=UPI002863BE5A|nr:polyamine aminopropyltransferase [Aliifodinibius sp. S!AR15-10]MDR8391568.1 polyamine aminopropyltransferase [Aliifodinibius sp. S!AR15-10]
MPTSYNEYYNGKTGLTVGVNEVLFSEQTEYQKVEVFSTDTWGNLMTIDGMVMLSEKDEFVYHEMLVHVGLFSHPEPERVLIIGGGDGGTAREVMRHDSVRQVDMVEIDEAVVRASKEFLPEVGDWNNPKLNVLFEDGIQFVKDVKRSYDVIIIDGSDPVGPAEGLFEHGFIRSCHEALATDGVLVAQTESPWIESYHPSMEKIFTALSTIYSRSRMYLAYIPLYPAGMWSFSFASKGVDPLEESTIRRVEKGMDRFGDELKYYNKDVHIGSFALPNFVQEII